MYITNKFGTDSELWNFHCFTVEHKGNTYDVVISTDLDNAGLFLDDSISDQDGRELGHTGRDGQIRDEILDGISENWDGLVSQVLV